MPDNLNGRLARALIIESGLPAHMRIRRASERAFLLRRDAARLGTAYPYRVKLYVDA